MDVRREIEKIDYLLDEIARSVEMGEIPQGTYDALAPKYLRKREKLVQAWESMRAPVVPESRTAPAATPAAPAAVPAHAISPPRERTPVEWTTWLAWTGALLVVIATAVFTVYRWETFSPEVKLLYLVGLTSAFYVGGEFVRARMGLRAVGLAITTVGAAMLLFDGWILITAFGLEGPWPWMVVLGVCWLIYWLTELHISGGWFGAMGAAAQIAWLWIFGEGLGLEPVWNLAVAAVIAAVWSSSSRGARAVKRTRDLALVLRLGAPAVSAFALVGMLVAPIFEGYGVASVLAAGVVAVAAAWVFESEDRIPSGVGVTAFVPLLVALVAGAFVEGFGSAPEIWRVAGFGLLAAAAMVAELAVGKRGYAALGLISEVFFWYSLGWLLDLDDQWLPVVFGAVAVSWLVAAVLMDRVRGEEGSRGTATLSEAARAGGWMLLVAATVATPLATQALPYVPGAERIDAGIAALMLVLWLIAAATARSPIALVVASAWSYHTTALTFHAFSPEAVPAMHAAVLLLPAGVWALLSPPMRARLGAASDRGSLGYALSTIPVLGIGVLAHVLIEGTADWALAALLAAGALVWLVEHLVRKRPEALGVTSALVVAAAIPVAAQWTDGTAWAVAAASATAAVLAAIPIVLPKGERGIWWSAGAACGAALVSAGVWDPAPAGIAFVTAAMAWVAFAAVGSEPRLGVLAAILAAGSVLNGVAYADSPPSVTMLAAVLFASTLVLPAVVTARTALEGKGREALRGLALVGVSFLILVSAIVIAIPVVQGEVPSWLDLGAIGIAVLLAVAGAHVLAWGWSEVTDVGVYPGGILLVFAGWALLAELEVTQIEPYLLLFAAYVTICGAVLAQARGAVGAQRLADTVSVFFALAIPLFASLITADDGHASFEHGLWVFGVALVAVALGAALKVRVYFFSGLVALVVEALWQSRHFLLALPKWGVIGAVGISLLVLAVVWDRKRMQIVAARNAAQDAFAGWR